jgi:hypothetical protein
MVKGAKLAPEYPGRRSGSCMARPFFLCALLALSACTPEQIAPPGRADLGIEVVRLQQPGPPKGPKDACWSGSTIPAVIETVTEQVLAEAEVKDAAGKVISPASYRTETRQRIVQDREEVWFRAPCPETFDVDFIATLQRSLKARGFYLLPLTGVLDAPTTDAIRRFQTLRGLDSGVLSLAAARELGLVSTDRAAL